MSYVLGPGVVIQLRALSTGVVECARCGGTGAIGPFNASSAPCSAIHWSSGDAWCRESVCGRCPGWPRCNPAPPAPPGPQPPSKPSKTSTLLRKGFVATQPITRAVVYLVGLGYYKLFINGIKASTHELGTFTNFATRYVSQICQRLRSL